ncbi:MAG TPA: DUF4234 domain-containing protein [Candidatus Bathyarchaeia archaeon]|nr:DUF4234 domain-containing protein [Candidatus Bathyarchaeia archaeon]
MENDPQMSTGWIAFPLFLIISIIVLFIIILAEIFGYIFSLPTGTAFSYVDFLRTIALTLLVYSLVAFVLNIAISYMIYKLVRRRNTHFARQTLLYEDLASAAEELATKKGERTEASIGLNNLERIAREARVYETEKNAALWVMLTLAGTSLPFVALATTSASPGLLPLLAVLYVYYFLMKDFFRHERREDQFIRELLGVLTISGVHVSLPFRNPPLSERSFAVYIVLSIVTLGFFWVYWVYVLLNDPNNHFRQQAMIEDTLMAQMNALLTSASPSNPQPAPPA